MIAALVLAAGFVHPTPQPAPDLPAAVYKARRERVMKELGGCAAVLASRGKRGAEDKSDDDFFWLTGVKEDGGWIALLPKAKYWKTVLFLRARDPEAERWTGPREAISPGLKERLGVDQVHRGAGGRAMLQAAPEHLVDA